MEIAQSAAAAAAFLGPFLAKIGESIAKKAAERIWDKAEALYQAIRQKFTRDQDAYAQQTLERLTEQPTSDGRQAALAMILTEKANSDPAFAQELLRLVQEIAQDNTAPQFLTQVYDQAQVGKIVNIAQAGIVQI